MKAFLIRHGITDWNLEKRVQGREDIELNEVGRKQAQYCADCLAKASFDCIVSSPLSRAKETAQIIAKDHEGVEMRVMDAFIERDFGTYSGTQVNKGEIMHLGEKRDDSEIEPKPVVAKRALLGLSELAKDFPNGNVCVITHGGVINAVLGELSDYRLQHLFLDNVFVTGLKEENGTFKILDYNVSPEQFDELQKKEQEWTEKEQ